jgi:hypothetical protein
MILKSQVGAGVRPGNNARSPVLVILRSPAFGATKDLRSSHANLLLSHGKELQRCFAEFTLSAANGLSMTGKLTLPPRVLTPRGQFSPRTSFSASSST